MPTAVVEARMAVAMVIVGAGAETASVTTAASEYCRSCVL